MVLINPVSDENGMCSCGLNNPKIDLKVELKFNKVQLPTLTNWQHWGKNEYVTALEPGTNYPVGQAKARENKELFFLNPFEKRAFDLELKVGQVSNLF